MKLIEFKEQTHTFGEGSDKFGFYTDGTSSVIVLQLTRDDLIKLKDHGGLIYIRSTTPVPPPIQLQIGNPLRAVAASQLVRNEGEKKKEG